MKPFSHNQIVMKHLSSFNLFLITLRYSHHALCPSHTFRSANFTRLQWDNLINSVTNTSAVPSGPSETSKGNKNARLDSAQLRDTLGPDLKHNRLRCLTL